jgi:3-hydroxybutyryl-CoA dehydratase
MDTFHVSVGDRATFSKTAGETDVYLFAGITGDFSGNHVNEDICAAPPTARASPTARS